MQSKGLRFAADTQLEHGAHQVVVSSASAGYGFTIPSPRIGFGDGGSKVLVPPTLAADLTAHVLAPDAPWTDAIYTPLYDWCAAFAERTGLNAATCERLNASRSQTKVAYLNFKSHFVFDVHRRDSLKRLLGRIDGLRFLCMSEALVPDALVAAEASGSLGGDFDFDQTKAVVRQPHSRGGDGPDLDRGSRAFWEMKTAKGGVRLETIDWMPGWNALAFGNPYFCPYGSNWGNAVLSKASPSSAPVVHHLFPHASDEDVLAELRAFNQTLNDPEGDEGAAKARLSPAAKEALSAIRQHGGGMQGRCLESRCMLGFGIPGFVIFSTHLEDRDADVRREQLGVALAIIDEVRAEGAGVLLLGDLNMLHLGAYTAEERRRLRALAPDGRLPELDARLTTEPFVLCNSELKHESLFCKNVCHAVRAAGGGNEFSNLHTGCVYTNCADHSLHVVAWDG